MNTKFQTFCNCSSDHIGGGSRTLQPREDYNIHDIDCSRYESDRDDKLLNDWKALDDDSWDVISALRQKFCQMSKSEVASTTINHASHSTCAHTNRQPYESTSVIERASNLIDYTPESEFLKKIKQQCQYLQNRLPNIFSALNDCFPEGDFNDCQKCHLSRSRAQLYSNSSWKCCNQQSDFRDEISYSSNKMRMKHSSIFQRSCSDRESVDQYECNGSDKQSEHVSRSKKPGRRRKIKKRKSVESEKCMSENDFEPSLKKPNENSCERCWRFASPARSPVNKPDQRYDPNFRRGHSTTNFEKGDGNPEICGEVEESSGGNETPNVCPEMELPCARHTCNALNKSPRGSLPQNVGPHICIKEKVEATWQMGKSVCPQHRCPAESPSPYSTEYSSLTTALQRPCPKHRASAQQHSTPVQHVCPKHMSSFQPSEPLNLRPKTRCPMHECESSQQRSSLQTSPQPGCSQQRSPQPGCSQQRSPQPGCSQQRSPQPGCSQQRSPQPGCSQQRSPQPGCSQQRSPQPGCSQQRSPQPGCSQQRSPQPGCSQQKTPQQRSPQPSCSQQKTPQQRPPQQSCSQPQQMFPQQRSPIQGCSQQRTPHHTCSQQRSPQPGPSHEPKHTCKQSEEPARGILCSGPGKKSRPQSCVSGSRDVPKSCLPEDLDTTEYKDICPKPKKQNFSPCPDPCNRTNECAKKTCESSPPKPAKTCDHSNQKNLGDRKSSKDDRENSGNLKDKSGRGSDASGKGLKKGKSSGNDGGNKDSKKSSKKSKSDGDKNKRMAPRSPKKSLDNDKGKGKGKGKGDEKKTCDKAGKSSPFDKAHPVRPCKCPPRIPEESTDSPRNGGHTLCCHCDWGEVNNQPTTSSQRPVNGHQGCSCNPTRKSAPDSISPIPKAGAMECPYRMMQNKCGGGRSQVGSCSPQQETHRCSRETHSEISTQELLECSPRKYFVFYTANAREKNGNDMEVLVEEMGQSYPKNDAGARTRELSEKMKKITQPSPDSMALRFQKGVSDSCRVPQNSRILYF